MRISGFSFARNADKLGYPIAESIRSILPICDEFVIAVGKGDEGDRTRDMIIGIGSPKIRIIDTEWTDREKLKNLIYSQQTNIALSQCKGDWCFYIQADEVMHEKYLDIVSRRCGKLLSVEKVEGLLIGYRHFWGDYDHFQAGHAWYPYEIRVFRNNIGVQSIGDAQSFCRKGKKLHVGLSGAEIYHYGYVRDPRLMQKRNVEIVTTYLGKGETQKFYKDASDTFDYGPLDKRFVFSGTHPKVMDKRIQEMNWKHLLADTGPDSTHYHHDKFKYRFLTSLEQKFLGGRQIGGFKNYVLLKDV